MKGVSDAAVSRTNGTDYFLIDPRDNSVFYAGKGTKNRMYVHAKMVKSRKIDCNHIKYARIESVHKDGLEVTAVVFSAHETEAEAYNRESLMIRLIGSVNPLTNISSGQATREERNTAEAIVRLNRFIDEGHYRKMPRTQAAKMFKTLILGSMGLSPSRLSVEDIPEFMRKRR